MTYNPNTPQPTDRISDTQAPILTNFQQLNTIYGTSGDHYPWTNQNPPETTKHAKVTLPGLPTANPPGNAIPAPAAGNCAIFAKTSSSITTPYLARDGFDATQPNNINVWTLMPIKVYASITLSNVLNPTVNDSFNVASMTGTSTVVLNIQNPMRTTTFGVIIFNDSNKSITYVINSTSKVTITGPGAGFNGVNVTIILLES
jgi:hypothetical protein